MIGIGEEGQGKKLELVYDVDVAVVALRVVVVMFPIFLTKLS